jgi:hypothetical protein
MKQIEPSGDVGYIQASQLTEGQARSQALPATFSFLLQRLFFQTAFPANFYPA